MWSKRSYPCNNKIKNMLAVDKRIIKRFLTNKGAVVALVFLIILSISSLLSFFLFDFDKEVIALSSQILSSPSLKHIFGTDHLGRDIFVRVMYGAGYSLTIGLGSTMIGMLIGLVFGSIAGYYQRGAGEIIMRVNEMFYSIPNILIATVVVSVFGRSFFNLLLSLSISSVIAFTRITRAQVIKIKSMPYIESALAIGENSYKIITRHILPNCISYIIVQMSLSVGSAIIASSSLSFLGIGIPLPYPEWGAMLSDARSFIRNAPWMSFFPGMFIMLTVLSFNLVGDGLRDAFDVCSKN